MSDSAFPPQARCEWHGLALPPDGGACVRCRRAAQEAATRRLLVRGAVVSAAILLLLVGYRAARATLRPPGPPRAAAVVEAADDGTSASRQGAMPSGPVAPTVSGPIRGTRDDSAIARLDRGESPTGGAVASSEPSGASPSNAGAVARERAVLEAMQRVEVIVYTTSWCPACRQARSWMNANRISYSERDVDRDRSAHDTLLRISGGGSIPTFDIEGQVRVGLSTAWINAAMRSAAERRLARNAM